MQAIRELFPEKRRQMRENHSVRHQLRMGIQHCEQLLFILIDPVGKLIAEFGHGNGTAQFKFMKEPFRLAPSAECQPVHDFRNQFRMDCGKFVFIQQEPAQNFVRGSNHAALVCGGVFDNYNPEFLQSKTRFGRNE